MIIEQEQNRGGNDFIDILHGDVLLHANALDDFAKGIEVVHWQSAYLVTYDCNSLNSPNITDWEAAINGKKNYGFHVVSPNSQPHVTLITHTRNLFEGLHWEQMRLLLGGEDGLQVDNPQLPITPGELDSYFDSAERQDIFTIQSRPSELNFSPDVISLMLSMRDYGFALRDKFDTYKEIEFHPRFREKFLHANLYKLACYLAVMDHATFEAQAEGTPVTESYIPTNRRWDVLDDYYQAKHGKSYPSMGDLYQDSHTIFVSLLGDRRDDILDHIINQRKLAYLI